jgi:signal transduction histidine kinase
MKKRPTGFIGRYFAPELDFRVRLFHILCVGGVVVSLLMGVTGIANHTGAVNIGVCFAAAALSWFLLTYARRTGRYELCHVVSVVGVFIVFFPVLFFASGGYHSGMPAFFVFAAAFTVFLLKGKKAVIFSAAELLIYVAICLAAYFRPETVRAFATESETLVDVVLAFVIVSIVLGVCMFLHFRLYDEQQRKLDAQNRLLEGVNKMKTELFANVSHEMKTPLTVISVHIQRAEKLFENAFGVLCRQTHPRSASTESAGDRTPADSVEMARDGDAAKIRESFALARDEITRMARLVNSALKLASMQEAGREASALDVGAVLRTSAEAYITLLEKQGNALELDIPGDLPAVYGSADTMTRIISNLLSNANAHTRGGVVRVRAAAEGKALVVSVEDDGDGIPPEILSRIFERGMTGGGGSGLGLFICRELARSHGGDVVVESEPGRGTKAVFTLPVREEEARDA